MERYKTRLGARHLWGLLWIIPLLAGTLWFAVVLACAVSGIFWLRRAFHKPKKDLDIVERIQENLNMDFAIFNYKPNEKKTIIGGFMIPILPFFSMVRSKKRFTEAIIHEHFHMRWMIYGFQTAFAYLLIAISSLLSYPFSYIVGGAFVLAWMLLQEYMAFNSTKNYADAMRFKGVRSFNKDIVKKYAVFYGSVIVAFILLHPLKQVRWSLYMLCLIGAVFLLGKMWYYFYAKWGWLKKEEDRLNG
jgi:hypothetical protein